MSFVGYPYLILLTSDQMFEVIVSRENFWKLNQAKVKQGWAAGEDQFSGSLPCEEKKGEFANFSLNNAPANPSKKSSISAEPSQWNQTIWLQYKLSM